MSSDQFCRLLQQHAGLIYKVALTYCRNQTDRQDVIQEIAINVTVSFHRRELRHNQRRELFDSSAFTIAAPSTESNPDLELLMRCVDELGDYRYRSVGPSQLEVAGCKPALWTRVPWGPTGSFASVCGIRGSWALGRRNFWIPSWAISTDRCCVNSRTSRASKNWTADRTDRTDFYSGAALNPEWFSLWLDA